jgi:predicted MFS family arabinose efflux permease
VGSILLALGEVGFAFSSNWSLYILSMVLFTIGEIWIVPAEYVLIDQITPEGMRGTYYGGVTFSNLGNFLGPWVGSIVLGDFGGTAMFLIFSLIALVGIIFYWRGLVCYRVRLKQAI